MRIFLPNQEDLILPHGILGIFNIEAEEFRGNLKINSVSDYMRRRGYPHMDLIDTSEATEEQKDTFARLHYHQDDEVRFCLSQDEKNLATFGLKDKRLGDIHIELDAGELLVIPAYTPHYFFGSGRFLRFFTKTSKWQPCFLD